MSVRTASVGPNSSTTSDVEPDLAGADLGQGVTIPGGADAKPSEPSVPVALVPLESMTSKQLIRRATLIETVIDLLGDVGPDAVQMREVAQLSGVAIGTAYRYFRSKDHLLAAALEDWQERLSRRILSATRTSTDPLSQVLEFLRRAVRAFNRNPEMTAIMLRLMTSKDPDAGATIDRMNRTNAEMFNRLLEGYPAGDIPHLSFALNAALTSGVTWLLTGRVSLDESLEHVEWTARALLGDERPFERA